MTILHGRADGGVAQVSFNVEDVVNPARQDRRDRVLETVKVHRVRGYGLQAAACTRLADLFTVAAEHASERPTLQRSLLVNEKLS
jgi:hypothetical protein